MRARPIEDLRLGEVFRNSIASRSAAVYNGIPCWSGWAIMEAFLAGLDAGRAERQTPEAETVREVRL